eukprot:6917047-Prymnesium_polylepis.1
MPSRRAEPIKHDQAQFPARFRILYRVVPSVMLDLEVQTIRLFQHRLGLWPPTRAVSVQATFASR